MNPSFELTFDVTVRFVTFISFTYHLPEPLPTRTPILLLLLPELTVIDEDVLLMVIPLELVVPK